jgi:hypothetical protein
LVVVVGVPAIDTWQALLIGAGVLALVLGNVSGVWWRLAVASVAVVAIIGLKTLLPRANIAEAHNPFIVVHDGEALQQGLPPVVYASWKAQFDRLYPPLKDQASALPQWRAHDSAPKTLFTQSSDAIWRRAKYTRQVDAIHFESLAEFRGAFANEFDRYPLYNFWIGEMARESMPFYVMYELTPASVGSTFAWQGQVFWERRDGAFDEISGDYIQRRLIGPGDSGKHVYAGFFPQRDPHLYFDLKPSTRLRLSSWVQAALSVAGVLTIVMLVARPRWPSYLRALAIAAGGYLFTIGWIHLLPMNALGKSYPPHAGGNDGLTHDGMGRAMAMLIGHGRIGEALEGTEPVYWNTPGTRYFRMLEKLFFGDTNHLYALMIACVPIVVFCLARRFVRTSWAGAITVVFCILPVGNLSYLQYIYNADTGFGDALGGGLFLLGLLLFLRAQPSWGGTDRSLANVWLAGVALAASMFVRPNFVFAVVWLGIVFIWTSFKRERPRALAAGLGLATALWMPFHNWFYGHEFHLISKSGATVSVPLGVRDYAAAFGDMVGLFPNGAAHAAVAGQLSGWLWDPGFVLWPQLMSAAWFTQGIKLAALVVSSVYALRWARGRADRTALQVIAVAAVCALLPMLFVYSTASRYAMLGWDLSLFVLAVLATQQFGHRSL